MDLLILLAKHPTHSEPEVISVATDLDTLAKMRDAYIYNEANHGVNTASIDFYYVERTLNTTVYNSYDTSLIKEEFFDFNKEEK